MSVRVTSTYDNRQVELIFNEDFLCLVRDVNIVDIELGEKIFNWKMRLVFEKNIDKEPFMAAWEYNIEGFDIKAILYNWESTSWVEMKNPRLIKTKDGSHSFYLKIRTQATTTFEYGRSIHLSIWKAI